MSDNDIPQANSVPVTVIDEFSAKYIHVNTANGEIDLILPVQPELAADPNKLRDWYLLVAMRREITTVGDGSQSTLQHYITLCLAYEKDWLTE